MDGTCNLHNLWVLWVLNYLKDIEAIELNLWLLNHTNLWLFEDIEAIELNERHKRSNGSKPRETLAPILKPLPPWSSLCGGSISRVVGAAGKSQSGA